MIKNIIFDLSEVIISGYIGVEDFIEQNYNIPAEDFIKRKQVETLKFFLDTMRGKYSEEEYCSYLLDGTNWNISVDEFKDIIRKNLNIPVEGTMDIIKELKGKYNLILLSDHVKEWVEYIFENNAELDIFDHKYFSYQYKQLKQDEGTFYYILSDLNIKPEETLFIDDSKRNVNKAMESGIKGIVFENANQLRDELNNLNII